MKVVVPYTTSTNNQAICVGEMTNDSSCFRYG